MEPNPILQLMPLLIIAVLLLPPLTQILHKAGYSRWWILLYFVPLVNIVALWLFAFRKWPHKD